MILQPYSDTGAFASGGKWEPTQANFPALAHFFKCNDAEHASVSSLIDALNPGVPSGGGGQTPQADGTIVLGASVTGMNSWVLTPPGTKHVVCLTVGKPAATGSNILFGSVTAVTNRGFRNPSAGSTAVVVGGEADDADPSALAQTSADTLVGTAGANWQAKATIIEWNTAAGLRHVGYDATTGLWTTTATPYDLSSPDAVLGITDIDQNINIGANSRPASIQVWYFTDLPSDNDIKSACTWTLAQIIADPTRKWAYPRWAGLE